MFLNNTIQGSFLNKIKNTHNIFFIGLPDSQLKNVQFVFVPLEEEGNFQISARYSQLFSSLQYCNINKYKGHQDLTNM